MLKYLKVAVSLFLLLNTTHANGQEKAVYYVLGFVQKTKSAVCGTGEIILNRQWELLKNELYQEKLRIKKMLDDKYNQSNGYSKFENLVYLIAENEVAIYYLATKQITPKLDQYPECASTSYVCLKGKNLKEVETQLESMKANNKRTTYIEVGRWPKTNKND